MSEKSIHLRELVKEILDEPDDALTLDEVREVLRRHDAPTTVERRWRVKVGGDDWSPWRTDRPVGPGETLVVHPNMIEVQTRRVTEWEEEK